MKTMLQRFYDIIEQNNIEITIKKVLSYDDICIHVCECICNEKIIEIDIDILNVDQDLFHVYVMNNDIPVISCKFNDNEHLDSDMECLISFIKGI